MKVTSRIAKFQPGQLVVTANAQAHLLLTDISNALTRHMLGDWGEVCPEDQESNDAALRNGGRLMSVYADRTDRKFWIITEADRSVTTILLPSDY